MNSHGLRTLAILVGIVALSIVGGLVASFPTELPQSVSLAIRNGEFGPEERVIIASNTPISINVVSRDYLYSVILEDPDSPTSVIVYPRQVARIEATLESGDKVLRIVQGCGDAFPNHRRQVVIEALSR